MSTKNSSFTFLQIRITSLCFCLCPTLWSKTCWAAATACSLGLAPPRRLRRDPSRSSGRRILLRCEGWRGKGFSWPSRRPCQPCWRSSWQISWCSSFPAKRNIDKSKKQIWEFTFSVLHDNIFNIFVLKY